jgi:hypothetical protein
MTHSPPVPKGNQSPYPLHKAPHIVPTSSVVSKEVAPTPSLPSTTTILAVIGGVIGLGAALFAGQRAFGRGAKAARH